MNNLTVIIPTLNEGEGIEALLKSIITLYPDVWCIVADDGSSDDTQEIVNLFSKRHERVSLLDRSKEPIKGLSASVWDGILRCTTPYFAVMDGDNQHPPEYLYKCFENLKLGADISLGAREPFGNKWRFSRIITSMVALFLAKLRLIFSGVTICDPLSGFFGGRTDFVKNIFRKHSHRMVLYGYKILFDILKVIPKDTKMSGFYYPFGLRTHGVSKFSAKVIYYFLLSLIS